MKKIMIIGGGMFSIPLIIKSKELGFVVVCVHHQKECPGFNLSDINHVCDASDLDELLRIAIQEKVIGVMTISEYAAYATAYIAEQLKLPGYSPSAVKIISNKYLFRKTLQELNIPQPGFGLAKSIDEAKILFDKLTKPVMVKPVNACGSRGVFKATNWLDIENKFRSTIESNFFYEGVIIEEYMEGQEMGGGVMLLGGKVFVPGITSKFVDENFIPFANILPGLISELDMSELKRMLEKIVDHFKIGDTYLNVNLILTSSGPRILELGARLAGNSSPEITALCYGVNPYEFVISYSANLSRKFALQQSTKSHCALIVGSKAWGRINKIHSFAEVFPNMKKLVLKEFWKCKLGDQVQPMNQTDFILGFFILQGNRSQDLIEIASQVQKTNWLSLA